MISILAEVILIISGCAGIIGNIIMILVLLISSQRTPTRIYISYIAVLSLLQQSVSPAFHQYYSPNYTEEFNIPQLLNLMFFILIVGTIVALMLLLLIDYFKCIAVYNIVIMVAHLASIILTVTLLKFLLGNHPGQEAIVMFCIVLLSLILLLLFISQEHCKCLKNRKQTDNESVLRHMLIVTFICSKIMAGIIFLCETLLRAIHFYFSFGSISMSFIQLDPILFLIVLFKFDHKFVNDFLSLTRLCSLKKSDHVPLQNQV